MLFRTEIQKRDLAWNWNRGDRAFFQAGACHILTDAFLRKFPNTGFRPLMILPREGFRGGHVVAASPEAIFDWHGFSRRDAYLAHYFRKLRRFFPGWDATLVELEDFMPPAFCQRFNHRSPDQYFRDPTPRAEAFVSRLVAHATSAAADGVHLSSASPPRRART